MRFITFSFISFLGCIHTVQADHASASFETGSAGAIMTMPGATLPKGKFVVGISVQSIELDDISDSTLEAAGAADEDVHSVDSFLSVSANLAYGLTDDLTIGLSMPYVDRSNIREAHNDMGVGEAELAGDSSGAGDLTLFGQYRFYQSEKQDAAILAGIKTPTGETGVREIDECNMFVGNNQCHALQVDTPHIVSILSLSLCKKVVIFQITQKKERP